MHVPDLYPSPRLARYLCGFGICVDLFLTMMPAPEVDANFSAETQSWDHEAHCLLYFLLTLCALMGVDRAIDRLDRATLFLAFASFGGILELLQPLVERSCSVSDFFANAAGALLAALLLPSRKPSPAP